MVFIIEKVDRKYGVLHIKRLGIIGRDGVWYERSMIIGDWNVQKEKLDALQTNAPSGKTTGT
jgi:hypothetical protein